MEQMIVEKSLEEQDLLDRSVEKPIQSPAPPPSPSVWQVKSGVNAVTGGLADTPQSFFDEDGYSLGRYADPNIYIGDEEDDNDMVEFKDAIDNLIGPETDEDAITIPLEECLDLWRPWRKALIIKLLGKSITYKYLCQRLSDLWKHKGRIEVTDLENGFYVVRFSNKQDYEVAVENGPWVILGNYLAVRKWKPFFQPESEKITTTLAWVRFSGLSLKIFRRPLLQKLGNMVGKFVKIDPFTTTTARGRFARVCIEIDLEKRLKGAVVINGRRYKVEYEGLQQICWKCGKFGHLKDHCPLNVTEEANAPESLKPADNGIQGPTAENPYGPWMIAQRRRRWNPNREKKSDQKVEQHPAQSQLQGTDASSSRVATQGPASGSRFDILIDEEAEETIPIPEPVKVLQEQVQIAASHGGQAKVVETSKQVSHKQHSNKKNSSPAGDKEEIEVEAMDDVLDEVRELRERVRQVESHGGLAITKEFHKSTSQRTSHKNKQSEVEGSSRGKPGRKNSRSGDMMTYTALSLSKRKEQTTELGTQGQQMKRTSTARKSSTTRTALSDLSNAAKRLLDPGDEAAHVILANIGSIEPTHRSGDHTKANPPNSRKLAVSEDNVNEVSGINPLFEVYQ